MSILCSAKMRIVKIICFLLFFVPTITYAGKCKTIKTKRASGINRELPTFLQIEKCTDGSLGKGEWNLLLLHNNDMHARFVETDAKQNECSEDLKAKGKCYGGFARVATVIRRAREEANRGGTPVLFLNAGDTFTGTPWFMVHKAPLVALSLNLLRPDAASLGNHEFDLGAQGIETLLNLSYGYPTVAANIDVTKEPGITRQNSLKTSVIFDVRGRKVAVIGYVLPETKKIAVKNNVIFQNEIKMVQKEVDRLLKQGVKIFIALGHSGFEMDREIAKNVIGIDVVIGGHTNTFLWNGEQPDIEPKKGPYPVNVINKCNKTVPVVQAFAHTKYMGRLLVTFNKEGEIIKSCGQPLLLDNSVPQAPDVVEFMKPYKEPVDKLVNEIVGSSIRLSVTDCRQKECDIGNVVVNSMLEAVSSRESNSAADYLVLQNAGGIRSALEPMKNGSVTYGALMTVLPYGNTIYKCKITGKLLKDLLEYSAEKYGGTKHKRGSFPQLANIRIIPRAENEAGNRIERIEVRCSSCKKGYKNYKQEEKYTLIVNSFIAEGNGGYRIMKDVVKENLGILDTDALSEYMKRHGNIDKQFLEKLRSRSERFI